MNEYMVTVTLPVARELTSADRARVTIAIQLESGDPFLDQEGSRLSARFKAVAETEGDARREAQDLVLRALRDAKVPTASGPVYVTVHLIRPAG